MTKDLAVSDEYWWNATSGLYSWVLEYLRDAVVDPAAKEYLADAVEHNYPVVSLDTDVSAEARRQALDALADETFLAAAHDQLYPRTPDEYRVPGLGHVRLLSLMAKDVLHNGSPPPVPWTPPQPASPPSQQPARTIHGTLVVSDEYSWHAAGDLFEWVVAFLRDTIQDQETQQRLTAAIDYQLEKVDFRTLPDPGRTQALQALRTTLTPALDAQTDSTMGYVKWLKLMAEDVLRGEGT